MEIDKEKLERIIRDIENGIGDTYLNAVSALKELIGEPDWEPKGGKWRVYGYGRIDNTSGTGITYRRIDNTSGTGITYRRIDNTSGTGITIQKVWN